jgi:hypothetical protein
MRWFPGPADVVVVHEAASEFEATTMRDLLAGAGIEAMIRTRFVPGYPGIVLTDKVGVWADILVRPKDEEAARALIAEYLASLSTPPEDR